MAAKRVRGHKDKPFSVNGKRYFFDVSIIDEMMVCYSCHPGGGPAEGIVGPNGVTPYTEASPDPQSGRYDRDFYTYTSDDLERGYYNGKTPAEVVQEIGEPRPHDWQKSGVMEADCLLCHIDPTTDKALLAADGLKVNPLRPRLMIFAERDAQGQVTRISLGTPLVEGHNQGNSALPYTNAVQRMSRPAAKIALFSFPEPVVSDMMKIMVEGLVQAEQATGGMLPYALYAPPEMAPFIYGPEGLKSSYVVNPNGPADEMARLQASQGQIMAIFQKIVEMLNSKYQMNIDLNQLMATFFNDYVYGYKVKNEMGQLMPVPVPLRRYVPGLFYTDWDDPNASTRDYVRSPLIEGEGVSYTGNVGLTWSALLYGAMQAMQGNPAYIDPASGQVNVAKVLSDYFEGRIPKDALQVVKRKLLPPFFRYMPSGLLMGLDFNQDGAPLTYLQLVRQGDEWQAKVYYNLADLGDGQLHFPIFGSAEQKDDWRWTYICGQCHVIHTDWGNSNWTFVRPYGLGMPADLVKNGVYINTNAQSPEDIGYDVHMSGKKYGCGWCHLRERGTLEEKHNFLKGTDTAHMVRNDLDNNPKPKTCEYCHLNGGDSEAPNPALAHLERFGETAGKHLEKIACEVCHSPYQKTWTFRAFDDTLGYYANFDNRYGYLIAPISQGQIAAFPPEYALNPIYGVSPGYGIPHFNMLSNHIDADGKGTVPMDYLTQMVNYFRFHSVTNPGYLAFGMFPTNPNFDFWHFFLEQYMEWEKQVYGAPISYEKPYTNEIFKPLYYGNGRNGYPQILVGNPITILTWVDTNACFEGCGEDEACKEACKKLPYGGAKVLYLREINLVTDHYEMPMRWPGYDPRVLAQIGPNDPRYRHDPLVGKVVLKPIEGEGEYVIYDHTGDMFPDIWWDEDVQAVRKRLIEVLKAEGEKNPNPVIFMAAHFFSHTHAIKPADQALGAKSCYDCHGRVEKGEPGAHRITDRVIVFLPWQPKWFREENRLLKWDHEHGLQVNNPNGFFVVDPEVYYIKPINANGFSVLGAKEEEILELSKHHAEELFYLYSEEEEGAFIEEIAPYLSEEERSMEFEKQLVNGPWDDQQFFYIPAGYELTECGIVPAKQRVFIGERKYDPRGRFFEAYVAKVEFEDEAPEAFYIKLPFTGVEPAIYTRTHENDPYFEKDSSAQILEYTGAYVLVRVTHPGEFVAIDASLNGSPPVF